MDSDDFEIKSSQINQEICKYGEQPADNQLCRHHSSEAVQCTADEELYVELYDLVAQ